jgi:hypothetical protein
MCVLLEGGIFMQIKVTTVSDPERYEYSNIMLTCTDAPLLLWELVDYVCQDKGSVHSPPFKEPFSLIYSKNSLTDVERELLAKWSSTEFLSLMEPIYSFCFAIGFDEIRPFLNRLGMFFRAEIFETHWFWKMLGPYLIELRDAFGAWSFAIDPMEHFSESIEGLPEVRRFVDCYAVASPEEMYFRSDRRSVSEKNIAKLMSYNQDMEYAYAHGIFPCALLNPRALQPVS